MCGQSMFRREIYNTFESRMPWLYTLPAAWPIEPQDKGTEKVRSRRPRIPIPSILARHRE